MNIALAYAECEAITRREARNFSYGIRLLPPAKRRALSAVYAMARRIDDIGDGDLPPAEKLSQLAAVRAQLRDLASHADAGHPSTDAVLSRSRRRRPALPDPARRVRRTGRRLRGRRARTPVQDVRRPGVVLPLRRRLGRPPVARRVRPARPRHRGSRSPTHSASPCSSPTSSRPSRGPPERPDLPAGGGPRPLRMPAGHSTDGPDGSRRSAGVRRPGAVRRPSGRRRGTPAASPCCRCSTGAAAPVRRRWPGSTTGCWTGSAPTPTPAAGARLSLPAGRSSPSRHAR